MNSRILTAPERECLKKYLDTGRITVVAKRILDQFKNSDETLIADYLLLSRAKERRGSSPRSY